MTGISSLRGVSYSAVPTGREDISAQPMKSTATKVKFGVAGVFAALAAGLLVAGTILGSIATFGALPLALLIGGAVCAAISGTSFTSAKIGIPKPIVTPESYSYLEQDDTLPICENTSPWLP